MLGKRILTAIIGIFIAIYVVNYGSWVFATAVSVLALLAWREYCIMLKNKGIFCLYWPGAIGVLLIQLCMWLGNSYEIMMIIFLFLLAVLIKVVVRYQKFSINDAAFSILGYIYIGLSFSYLIAIRFSDFSIANNAEYEIMISGMYLLWMIFLGTWASDTFAYFIGSRFGKNKLCPALSPGKTREGAIGGVVGSIITVVSFGQMLGLNVLYGFIIGLIIGIVAPLGDLTESALKRFAGVKDSGNLLPGHGGVLDRFDSIMFSVPVVYYYVSNVLM